MSHSFLFKMTASTCLISSLCGCGYKSVYDVARPTDVTVGQALRDVGTGLGGLKEEMNKRNLNAGLLVDEVTLTLNVSASADRTGKLVVDASSPIAIGPSPGSAKIGAELGSTDKASRSNQITIRFKNWYTAQLNSSAAPIKQPPPELFDENSCWLNGRICK